MMEGEKRDHGGGVDAAARRFGGTRADWLDLSTGINPVPYPGGPMPADAWTALPDRDAFSALEQAARRFWKIPQTAAVLAAPGASALIARIPALRAIGSADIPTPTYNEHAAAFAQAGWTLSAETPSAGVVVHPNKPDGRLWDIAELGNTPLRIIDESFCDICPERSHMAQADTPGTLILKSFGKFWGLAGMRLGFAVGDPALVDHLSRMLGPWPVSGPALAIGRQALEDLDWAEAPRTRLVGEAARRDRMMTATGATLVGGTPLFRLYDTEDAAALQTRLARHRIWTRIFPYSDRWIRLGLPGDETGWSRLETAL
jgi:cobalamin biosynthetic protein CobC